MPRKTTSEASASGTSVPETVVETLSIAETIAAAREGAQFKIALKSMVSLYGTMFKPGQNIIGDASTVNLMGDAVDHVVEV